MKTAAGTRPNILPPEGRVGGKRRNRLAPAALALITLLSTAAYPITSGADFLRIPKSARAVGLGESSVAIIGDSTALDYNPAVMNTIQSLSFSSMYQSWIDNTFGIYVSGVGRLGLFVMGASVYYFDYGGFTQYDTYGGTVAQFNPHDLSVRLGVSCDAALIADSLKGLSVGFSLAGIERDMLGVPSFGYYFDLGVNYSFNFAKFGMDSNNYFARIPIDLGFSIRNLGMQASDLTPASLNLGIVVQPVTNLLVAMDMATEYGRPFVLKFGAEYTLFRMLIFRAGFNAGKDTGNFAFGLGIRVPDVFRDLRVDYALSPLGSLGMNHNVSLYIDIPMELSDSAKFRKASEKFSAEGNVKKAREMMEKVFELRRDDAEVSNSLELLKEAEVRESVEVIYQTGLVNFVKGEYETARKIWKEGLDAYPGNKRLQEKLDEVNKILDIKK